MSRGPDWLHVAMDAAAADRHAHVYHSLGCRISGEHEPDCTPSQCGEMCGCCCDATELNAAIRALHDAVAAVAAQKGKGNGN